MKIREDFRKVNQRKVISMAVGEHILNLIKLHFDGFKWIGLCCIICHINSVTLMKPPKGFLLCTAYMPFQRDYEPEMMN